MIIKGDFYKLTQIDDATPRFDLELLRHVGGKNPRDEFKIEGYGMSLDYAIHKVITFAITNNLPEEVTLKEYIDEFKKIKDEIKRTIGC